MSKVKINDGGFLYKDGKDFNCLATEPLFYPRDKISYRIAEDVAKKYKVELGLVDVGRGEDESITMIGFKVPYVASKKEDARELLERAAIDFDKRLDRVVKLSKLFSFF